MAFNGSGTFNRTNGTNSGTTTWQLDEAASVDILSTLHDSHDQDLANGLTNCITKDGQSTPTANIPFGGFRLTNTGAATARTDAARASQVQDGSYSYAGVSTGSSNTYAATISPAPTALADGMVVRFRANHANTGAATFNLNSLGAVNIKRGAPSIDPIAGAIQNNAIIELTYSDNGTCWFITSETQNARLDDVSGLAVTDGGIIVGDDSNFVLESGATARASLGAAKSGANSDITALTGITLSTWSPTLTASGSMTVSSLAINDAKYQRIGGAIHFYFSANFTLGGSADQFVYIPRPTSGSAMNLNVTLPCAATENGSAVDGPRWRYDHGGSRIIVFKPGSANWVLGTNASVHIQGWYPA